MTELFREAKRVLKKDGTLWLNLGDSYAAGGNGGGTKKQDSNRGTLALKGKPKKSPAGFKPKDLVGIPWRVALALQADGWYLRQDIIWHKPNPMPESVTDRCTKSHEYVFLMAKSPRYYFDSVAIAEPVTDVIKYKNGLQQIQRESLAGNEEIQRQQEGAKKESGVSKINGGQANTTEMETEPKREGVSSEVYGGLSEIWETKRGSGQAHKDRQVQSDTKKISKVAEGQGMFGEGSSQKTGGDEPNTLRPDSRSMGGDTEESKLSLQDLSEEETINERPHNSIDERRSAHSEQHSSGLSELQRSERKPHKSAITPGQTPHGKALKRMAGEKDPDYQTRNKRSVWTITTKPFKEAHFATFPEDLIIPMVKAGCPKDGIVLDPFMGAGTTGLVAKKLGRSYIGIEINPKYIKIAEDRIKTVQDKLL